jgi:hypothetical protein
MKALVYHGAGKKAWEDGKKQVNRSAQPQLTREVWSLTLCQLLTILSFATFFKQLRITLLEWQKRKFRGSGPVSKWID